MSKRCELTGIGSQTGHTVSHSNIKTKRRFNPNLRNVSLKSQALGRDFSLKISAATLRSIDHNGGLDNFLVTATSNKLTALGQKIRRKIKKAVVASASAPKPKAEKPKKAKVERPKAAKKAAVAKKKEAAPSKKKAAVAAKKSATKKKAPVKKAAKKKD